jgi:uncharacterized protein DUF4124
MNGFCWKESLTAILIIGILASSASVSAQQKVYKWVDEEGVVHYSEEPPGESPKAEVETFTTDPAPPYVPPAQTTVKSQPASETSVEKQSAQPEIQIRPPVKEMDITEMSLADLDRRCEDAREKRIAPLRKAEIEKCIQTGTGDQGWCDVFWADYGDAQRTKSGVMIPRQFSDIPECVEALDERHRRM